MYESVSLNTRTALGYTLSPAPVKCMSSFKPSTACVAARSERDANNFGLQQFQHFDLFFFACDLEKATLGSRTLHFVQMMKC